jgi:hypothetical protein
MNHAQSSAITWNLWEDRVAFLIAALGVALAASVFYSPLPLLLVLAIPCCYYFISRPYQLLLVMVFLIPFNFVFKIGPVPVAFEVIKVFAWIPFVVARRQRSRFISSRANKWFAVMAGIIVLSLIRAHDFPFTLKECVRLGSNLGLVYLCINLVDSRERVLQVLRVLTVSTFLVACYGFYQWAIQDYGALFWIVNPRLETNLAHYRDYFWQWRNRIISVLTSEMELGHYFNMCLPIGVVLWLIEGRTRSKWLLMALAILAGLVLTFTFGAWLALATTCGLGIIIFGGAGRWKLLFVAVIVLSLVAGLLAMGPLRPFVEQKATGTAIGSLAWDAATRLLGWRIALQTWWSHPLIGVGIGNFEFLSAEYDFVLGAQSQGSSPHQTYLYLLANYGLIGTIAVLAILVTSIRINLQLGRSGSDLYLIALALAFALAVNLIGGFSDDSTYLGPHTSYLLWLLIGLTESVRNLAISSAPATSSLKV